MCDRAKVVIPGLLKSKNKLEARVLASRRRELFVSALLGLSWLFFIVFVLFFFFFKSANGKGGMCEQKMLYLGE